jgi:ribosomal protein L13
MLPKNRLRDKRLARLKVFEGTAHPYKQNIIKFAGQEHKPGFVMEAIEASKTTAS